MDAEARMLLYAVILGSGVGLVSMLRRRALAALRFHAGALAALLTASVASVLAPELGERIATPVAIAFGALAILPSVLVMAGRGCARRRRFVSASMLVWGGGALLGMPTPIRYEAGLYRALATSDRRDLPAALEQMRRLEASGALPSAHGGRTLAVALPLAGSRRWDEALAILDAEPNGATAVLAIEARAAAETGDLRRALRACERLRARSDAGAARLSALRYVLAAAGRSATLREAIDGRWPILQGSRQVARLALARAHEARGEDVEARALYERAARWGARVSRLEARDGLERLDRDQARRAAPDELELDEILRLEAACRDEARGRPGVSRRRPWATWAATCLTTIVSVAVILGPGIDSFSLLVAGALSAPLIAGEGQWWRLFMAMLLHGGWLHLIFNLGCVVPIGALVERRVGAARTIVIYLGSGLMGSLASVYLNGTDVGVGASGAAMGLIGALLVLMQRRPALFLPVERRRWVGVLWVGVIATGVIGLLEHQYVDNSAHGAGFAGGMLLAALTLPSLGERESRLRLAGARLGAALLVALLAAAMWEARVEGDSWSTPREVPARGATVRLPGWLRVTPRPDGSVVAERLPAEIAILVGAEPYSVPDPNAVIPETGPLRDLVDAADLPAVLSEGDFVLPVPAAALAMGLAPEWESGVRFLVIRNGAAFALVRLPADPTAEDAYSGPLDLVRATLRVAPEGARDR